MQKNLPGNRLSRWLALVFMALLSTSAAWAQSTANYTFTTSTTGSLVDMSSGTTDALATGTYRDDDASTVQSIGFTFGFMGTAYTQFSVNSNGQLRLGATAISGGNASAASGAAILAALGGDNAILAAGKVHYKVVAGTNRTLVVEWNSLRIPFGTTAATSSVVQAILEENTGKIEYRYGAVYNNSTSIARPIFISAGTSAGQIGLVKTFTTTPTYDATVTSTSATTSTTALADNAAVAGLNSAADGSRTTFTFTPPSGTPAAPAVATSAVGQTGLTLNITDNSTNEGYFTVARSTDNTTFTTLGTVLSTTTAATGGTVTFAQAGLLPGTTYYYRVTANNEAGGVSSNATATTTTAAAVPICGTKLVGPSAGADYPTLTAAFTAITVNGLCGPLVLELQAAYVSTTETFPLVYNYTGTTATNTVTVRPTAGATGLSITGTGATAVFNIVGGKYLILDGRPGGSGTTVSGAAQATDLTIASTSTSGIPLQFTSDATFNVVQHCQIKGVGTSDSGSPDVNFTGTATAGNSDNTIQYCNIGDGATTPVTLVYGGSTLNSRNSLLNNNLLNNYGTASTYGIYLNQSGTGWTITGNSLYQTANRVNVSGTMYGIYVAGGGHTITNNFIGGSAASAGGTPLTVTTNAGTYAAYRFVGIYLTTSGTATSVQGNTVANITWASSSGASTTYGVVSGIYVSAGDTNIGTTAGNLIGTVAGPISVTTSTTGGYSFGISSASSGTLSIVGNTISNFTGAGSTTSIASNVAGILASAGTANTISRNKIYNLAAGGGVANISNGIWLTGGTLNTVTNNLIGDLRAATSTSLLGVSGILVAGGTTDNVYYNTVNLAATSTGATFGTSGIYLSSTSAVLDLRNNIVVNKSTAAGTGGYTAALRRVSGTAGTIPANLAATTNNNLYYAGTPSATNLIYVEGTTTATNAQQTLATYKAFVAARDNNSVTEDVPFLSTTGTAATFLHISPTAATQVESAGTPISGITTDFDGDTRNATTPDIGADEGTFVPLDLTPPVITFTALLGTSSTASRTLAVTITDVSGIATGTGAPRIYYRKGTSGTFFSAVATTVSGSTYTFLIDYANVGGATTGDVIQYYVAAQDASANNNVTTSPTGGSGANPPGSTGPATVNQYTILTGLSGIYYVGTSTSPNPARTYATLTAAANAYSTSGLDGAVTFLLLDPSYTATTGETFPIAFFTNGDASATKTLTISPNTGVSATVTAAGSVLAMASSRYITIDGSNTAGGTTRNLTLNNTVLTASTYVLGMLTQTGQAQANQFATVRNVNIVGGGATTNATLGIVLAGADNDNVTLQNNSILGVTTGIQAVGTTLVSVGGLDNLVLTGNVVGPVTATTGSNINSTGILVSNALAPAITGNTVQNVTSAAALTGLQVQNATTPTITGNSVLNLVSTASTVYGLASFATTNATISQNLVQNLTSNSGSGLSAGLLLASGTTGAVADRNRVLNLTEINTGGNGVKGIEVQTGLANANVRISNNFVQVTAGSGYSGTTFSNLGIRLSGTQSGINIYYNSVNMTGTDVYNAVSVSAGLAVVSGSTGLDVRNNIFRNSIVNSGNSGAKAYALYSTAPASAFTNINNNDYFVSGTQAVLAYFNADVATLAALRSATTGTGQDANSITADPMFVSTTDLHVLSAALDAAATPIAGITTDIDGDVRNATTPDIGADEFTLLTNDLAAAGLVAPATTSTCYGTAEPVSVSIRNAGTAVLNFATNAATITVVVTLPGGGTQTLTTTVNTGTLASGATQTVTLPTTLNMATVGTYTFAITATVVGDGNTTNDLLAPAPTRTVAAPVAGTLAPVATNICVSGTATLTLTGAANGSIQFQSSPDNVTFTDIAGATNATYTTPVINTTTYYRAQVRCNTGTATSNVSTITVSNPLVATTNTPVSICAGSTATLTASASAGSSVRFFTTATGGTALATAGTYTTPALTANTTYYAEAFTPNASSENVGKATSIQTDGGFSGSATGLVFTATGPVTLQSTTVYNATTTAGSVSVELRDNATGTLITTVGPFTVNAGSTTALIPTVLPLNLAVPAAGTYRLVTAATPTPATLYRDFSTGNAFPYTSPSGVVSITGGYISGASTVYYFFFNIAISTDCVGATRTPIQVNVTQPATVGFPAATASTCGSTPYQLAGTVTGSATTGTYTTSGTGTFSPNATALNATYTPSAADVTGGSVTITLTSTVAPCAPATATLALSIGRPAVATFTYPTATTYCAGSTSTVTPTLGTGATAGTFTVSPATGLTINATTGVITLSTSTAGTYTVTNTVAASGACAAATATATVTITPATSAAFSYAASSYCVSGTTNPTPTITGTTGGTFSSTTGLSLNATTGVITLASSTPGTYTVTYTVAGACGSSATASVTITAGQAATFSYPATGGNCAGSTGTVAATLATGATAGTFTSTTGLTINATTGAVNLATSTAGTYTVTNTVAVNGGCAAATATATVTVNPTPARPTLTPTYNGTVTTLTSSAATGNQFYFNGTAIPGATGQTYVINGSTATYGAYTVVATNSFGCSSQASLVTTITTSRAGIAGASLLVYPNPTPTGQVTLELSGLRSTTQLAVLDALGRVVRAETLPATAGTATHTLDLSHMASGVYLLRLTNADGVETRRLVRE